MLRSLLDEQGPDLGDVVRFGQELNYDTTVAAEIKALMKSLAHRDEGGIGKFLPLRRGSEGLHLAEAIGHLARSLDRRLQVELRSQIGDPLEPDEAAVLERAETTLLEQLLKAALQQLDSLAGWFDSEATELRDLVENGGSYERYFISLNEPTVERVALALTRIKFGDPQLEKTGLIAKLGGLFGGK